MSFDEPSELEPNEFEMALFYLKQGQELSPKEVEIITKEIEALQQWINDLRDSTKSYVNCVYCGHRYGPSATTPVALASVLKKHVAQCPKHPLSQAIKSLKAAATVIKMLGGDPGPQEKMLKWLEDGPDLDSLPADLQEDDSGTNRVVAYVVRGSADELTFAVVSCLRTDEIDYPDKLLEPIEQAVTEWIATSESGRRAWKTSSEDFNVGDLSSELGDKDLQACLVANGVFELEIETSCNDAPVSNWTYDTVLYDEFAAGEFEEAEESDDNAEEENSSAEG